MKARPVHTSSTRIMDKQWLAMGGTIKPIRGTGELRYEHPLLPRPLRVNGRRTSPPAKLASCFNQVERSLAASR